MTCFSGSLAGKSEANSLPDEEVLDTDEELCQACCLLPSFFEVRSVAPTVVPGLAISFFALFGAGSSSLSDEFELELTDGAFLRFKGFVISMAVGFRDDAPRPAFSFSSSASLSEVEVADEDDVDGLGLPKLLAGFGDTGASFMSMLQLGLSLLSSLLPLLLVCSASASDAFFLFLFAFSASRILVFLVGSGAAMSSPSLLLVSSKCCFSS